MANFKRRRPKNSRAGCLLCKYHKSNGMKDRFESQTRQEKAALISDKEVLIHVK